MSHQQTDHFKHSRHSFLLAAVVAIVGLIFVLTVVRPLGEIEAVVGVLVLAMVVIGVLVYLMLASQARLRALLTAMDDSPDPTATAATVQTLNVRLRSIFDNAHWGMAFLDLDGRFLQVNQTFCQTLGYDDATLLTQPSQMLVLPDDQAAYEQALADLLAEQAPYIALEQHYRHKNGQAIWLKSSILLLRDALDQPDCFVVQIDDRSQEKEMEEALWQQILRNELILQTATDGFCMLDIAGSILEANASFATITGYTQDELLTMELADLKVALGERSLAEYLAVVQQQDNLRFQTRCQRRDGRIIEIAASLTLIDIGQTSYILLSAADITAQKEANTQIQESRQMLQLILDLIPTRVFWKDANSRYLGYNRQWVKDTGLLAEELLGKTDYEIGWSQAELYQADDQKVMATGEPLYNIEEVQDRPDGSIGWLNTHKIPLRDDDGAVVGILGTYEDITQRKQTADRLRASEARLQAIFDNAAGIALIDTEGNIIQANDHWLNQLGYTPEELPTLTFASVTYEDDLSPTHDYISALLRGDITTHEAEKRYIRKDGSVFWAHVTISALPDADGEVVALIGMMVDVTERKKMEVQLSRSEARYRALFENMPVALQVEDFSEVKQIVDDLRSQGITDLRLYFTDNPAVLARCIELIQVVDVNHKSLDLYNVAHKTEVIGTLSHILPIESYPAILDEIIALCADKKHFSRGYQLLDGGKTHTMNLSIAPGYENTWGRILFSMTDITALKQAETAEHEQRTLAETLQDVIAALASSLDADEVQNRILENIGRVVPHDAANIGLIEGSIIRIHKWRGYPEKTGDFMSRLTIPLDTPTYQQMIADGKPCLVPHIEQHSDWTIWPELAWVRSYAAAPIKTHDKVIGFLNLDSNTPGFFTEEHVGRLQAFADQVAIALENAQLYAEIRHYANELEQRVADRTAELEHERAQLQAILEGMGEGVVYAEGLTVRYVNAQLLEMTGYSFAEFTRDVMDLVRRAFPQDIDPVVYFAQSLDLLTTQRVWHDTMTITRADGSQFEGSMMVTLVNAPDDELPAVVMLLRDISQEKALQDQKDQFIANASHELRTPLANMKMRLYLLNKQPSKTAEHMRVLEIVTVQMQELVENLLDLSRFDRGAINLQCKDIVLQTLLVNVIALQQPTVEQRGLTLVQEMQEEPVHLVIDGGRMTQVFTNLVANAINYTPAGGTITLRLETRDEHILIHVEDNGLGIPADALDQIFEPFFRVNERHTPGTGLGLSISREIIMLHGGQLTVTSIEGQGSTFTITLPRPQPD